MVGLWERSSGSPSAGVRRWAKPSAVCRRRRPEGVRSGHAKSVVSVMRSANRFFRSRDREFDSSCLGGRLLVDAHGGCNRKLDSEIDEPLIKSVPMQVVLSAWGIKGRHGKARLPATDTGTDRKGQRRTLRFLPLGRVAAAHRPHEIRGGTRRQGHRPVSLARPAASRWSGPSSTSSTHGFADPLPPNYE